MEPEALSAAPPPYLNQIDATPPIMLPRQSPHIAWLKEKWWQYFRDLRFQKKLPKEIRSEDAILETTYKFEILKWLLDNRGEEMSPRLFAIYLERKRKISKIEPHIFNFTWKLIGLYASGKFLPGPPPVDEEKATS